MEIGWLSIFLVSLGLVWRKIYGLIVVNKVSCCKVVLYFERLGPFGYNISNESNMRFGKT